MKEWTTGRLEFLNLRESCGFRSVSRVGLISHVGQVCRGPRKFKQLDNTKKFFLNRNRKDSAPEVSISQNIPVIRLTQINIKFL